MIQSSFKLSAKPLLFVYLLIHLCLPSIISGLVFVMSRSTLSAFRISSIASQIRRRSFRWSAFPSQSSNPVRSPPTAPLFSIIEDAPEENDKKKANPKKAKKVTTSKSLKTETKTQDMDTKKKNSSLWALPSLDDDLSKNVQKEKGQISSFFDAVDARMQQVQSHDRNVQKMSESSPSSKKNTNKIKSAAADQRSIFDDLPFLLTTNSSDSSKKSIFDMFPVQQPKPRNPNAFPEEAFQEYKAVITEVTENIKFRSVNKESDIEGAKLWLLRDERQIPVHLPTLTKATMEASAFQPEKCYNESKLEVNDGNNNSVNDDGAKVKTSVKKKKKAAYKTNSESIQFGTELKKQREVFLKSTNLTASEYQVAGNVLCYLGDYCAKLAISAPFEIAWQKLKEAGIVPREQYMSTFLYVVGTSGSSFAGGHLEGGSILDMLGIREHIDGGKGLYGISPPKSDKAKPDNDKKTADLPAEVATFHDLLYQPTEKSISLRVKNLVANGDAAGAEALLNVLQPVDTDQNSLKLRTYLPVLRAYCDQGDCSAVLKLFNRMRNSPGVILEPENYVLVIATLAECGYFKKKSKPIAGAIDAGYSVSSGPKLLDELAIQMADDSLDITSASARRLHNAFISANAREAMISNLQEIPSLAAMPVNNELASDDELVVSRVTIDAATGLCPRTQAKLRLISLKKEQRQEFLDKLMKLAESQYLLHNKKSNVGNMEGNKHLKQSDDVDAAKELRVFADFLSNREGKPFTAIIDGANVAYFGQNFEQGRFNYYQIKFLIDALESKGEHPLVILPQKYTREYFFSNTGPRSRRQYLNNSEMEIIRNLNLSGKLYLAPAGCLDDYYWMLASLSDQTKARNNMDINVSIDNEEGRWPGTRPMLLSNDQMRDHKLELIEPRLFRRWTSSHIVNYNFTAFVNDECVDREIGFSAPDFYSKEIQGNFVKGGGAAWHFPVSDWDDNERFCIRLPNEN